MKSILTKNQIKLTVKRLAHQILENHLNLENTVLIGIQPRGIFLSDRIVDELKNLIPSDKILYGRLDITFYRDDIREELKLANATKIPFSTAGKNIVIIDDVLWTGRTIRSALDALIDFGRPQKVELCVLIDRRFSRELPIQADYVGRAIDTFPSQKVYVRWQENHGGDEVILE
ncbi:bifunctional pyr operon transcriptional regulator/uracil phosphoribosyltransferase PyrR [Parafilimonas terrae]|uniref:Pyrimidine operon attenuation protein / uracil phosphoribosyltransferase n=1 Tax=Parafilimonas terrae TaxID=1465490 RepID=A0A1I5U278_9BACT|nr:bifunctional pyr operon transcriptional regulator/uracil phosphoribosyltransferase PyrR [Parafilimonas terrae]SFP89369.1 pyrimidine operon attenuation protein / uracil phosphoribosyltransferase [Parafilimonas terrae]